LLNPTPLTSAILNMPPASHEIETRISNACEAMDNDPKLKGIALLHDSALRIID
jgi:hypothetical protein